MYGDGLNIRDWLHVEDHASAIWDVLTRGRLGEVYNIGGGAELANIDVVRTLLRVLGKPESLIQYVTDRAGPRPSLRDGLLRSSCASWAGNRATLRCGIGGQTVHWYVDHRHMVGADAERGLSRVQRLYLKGG